MKREIEYYQTELEATKEGERCRAYMGPGYGYTFRVWFNSNYEGGMWALEASWYDSCD